MVVHWCPYSRAKAWQSNCYYTGERLPLGEKVQRTNGVPPAWLLHPAPFILAFLEPMVGKMCQEPKNYFLASMCPKWVPDSLSARTAAAVRVRSYAPLFSEISGI